VYIHTYQKGPKKNTGGMGKEMKVMNYLAMGEGCNSCPHFCPGLKCVLKLLKKEEME
jgi:hypothetical protein